LGTLLRDVGELRENGPLRASMLLLFFLQFGMGATNPLMELYVRDVESWWSWLAPSTAALFFSMSAANLVSMPLWGSLGDRAGAYPALRRCSALCAIALAVQGLAPSYEVLLAARVLFGVAMAGSAPLAFGVAAAESSASQRGGAIGVVFAARAFAIAVASMLGGALSTWVGVRGLFLGSAALLALCLWGLRRPSSIPAP
jgi:MFS family permease